MQGADGIKGQVLYYLGLIPQTVKVSQEAQRYELKITLLTLTSQKERGEWSHSAFVS